MGDGLLVMWLSVLYASTRGGSEFLSPTHILEHTPLCEDPLASMSLPFDPARQPWPGGVGFGFLGFGVCRFGVRAVKLLWPTSLEFGDQWAKFGCSVFSCTWRTIQVYGVRGLAL